MKKLKLDLSNLTVESFDTTPGVTGVRGTIRGQDDTHVADTCNGITCHAGCQTGGGGLTCGGGCGGSDTAGACCSAACTVNEQTCQGGMTGCGCASTVACGSQVTLDCGGCNDTAYNNSCTDQGCTYCANAC